MQLLDRITPLDDAELRTHAVRRQKKKQCAMNTVDKMRCSEGHAKVSEGRGSFLPSRASGVLTRKCVFKFERMMLISWFRKLAAMVRCKRRDK